MDNSYLIGDLQNKLQSREEILLSKEAKTRGCFKECVSRSTLIAMAQGQQCGNIREHTELET